MGRIDENTLTAAFAEVEAPPGLDRWRERIADVDAESCAPETPENDDTVVPFPTNRDLRPRRYRRGSMTAVAAAAAVIGLGGLVVTTQLFSDAPSGDPTMIIDGPDRTDTSGVPPTTRTTDPLRKPSTPPTQAGGPSTPRGTNETPAAAGGDGIANPVREPGWPAMPGDPTAANTGDH